MFKKLFYSLTIVISFAICIFAYSHISANAQTSNYDVTVSPVFFDLSVNPGGSVSERVRVRNNTNSPISVNVEVKRLTGDETGALTINDENSDNSLSWIKLEETTYRLSPLEWTNIPFSIEVPENAAYGYYYTINFTDASTEETDTTGATITGAAAVPVLLNVRKDGAVAEAKLADFSVGSYINEYLPVEFNVNLKNTGNVHIRPVGNIFISGMRNDSITTIEVNDGQGAIIPDSTRIFESSWEDGFIVKVPKIEDGQTVVDKNGNPKTELKINWNQLTDFRLGKYSANLVMVYDNGERDVPIEASIAFWVIPYKVIIGGIIAIIIIIILVRFLLKRYINREIKKRST